MSGLRDFVQQKDDKKYIKVIVPEWDNREVWLCSPHSEDRDKFEEGLLREKRTRKANGKVKKERTADLANIRAKLVVICVCEGEGNPTLVFKPEDAEWLGKKNAAALDRLYDAAQSLAGVNDDDIEELAKN